MRDVAAHFDHEAAAYPTDVGEDYTQARKWALIEAHLPRGGMVVDIGAANGRHARKVVRHAGTVVAVDPSRRMLGQIAVAAGDDGPLPCAAALPVLPFAPGTFDLVYCFSTLLLLPIAQQHAALAELARLLRPGGVLVIDVAGRRSLAIRYWHRYYRRRGLHGVFGWRLRPLRTVLAKQGLDILSVEAHGVLAQFLLFPGASRLKSMMRRVRGQGRTPGWDAVLSQRLPAFAERWYVVAQRPAVED